jgi:hypothetical protein
MARQEQETIIPNNLLRFSPARKFSCICTQMFLFVHSLDEMSYGT